MIEVLLHLLKQSCVSKEFVMLVETAVQMSKLLYMDEADPHNILHLYNCSWLHHELCNKLIKFRKKMTANTFYGTYLHALAVQCTAADGDHLTDIREHREP